jgi:trypsin
MKGISIFVVALAACSLVLAKPKPKKPSTSTYVFPGRNTGRIVGGVEATPHEFPWIVDMRVGGSHYCGGSIISPEWVVTAAHCSLGSGYTLTAGDHNIDRFEGTEQTRNVDKIIVHPGYQAPGTKRHENDIALMHVSTPFEFNQYVGPVDLPKAGFPPTPVATVTGWGALTQGGASPSELYKVDVPYVDDANCDNAYSGGIADSMICYGEAGKDSCQGDSGGPIICGPNNTLCGIVSWGQGCAQPGYPGVYTETSYYEEWIRTSTTPTAEDPTPVITIESCASEELVTSSSARINLFHGQDVPAGYRCTLAIQTPYDSVRVRLISSGLGSSDGIFITNFDTTNGVPRQHIQINSVGQDVLVQGGFILFTFSVAVGSTGSQGFSLEYYSSGFETESSKPTTFKRFTTDAGEYSHPAGGGQYGNGERTVFLINSANLVVSKRLDFTRFIVEDDFECSFDAVRIYDWSNDRFNLLSTECGSVLPDAQTLPRGLGLVAFTTDDSITATGFTFRWI